MGAKRRTYLIQDPYDTDAQRFMVSMFRHFGLRPVCFYTDAKARYYGERAFPNLRSQAIEAAFDVSLDDLGSFAEMVSENYEIVAVIPYREDTVEVAAELVGLLELSWNSAETVGRFRDKHALKTFVNSVDPAVRVPASRIVSSPDDVWTDDLPDRFVIKPNSGYGNMDVGIFDRTETGRVNAKLAAGGDTTWILEEFIGGEEYEVDGQVRPDGSIDVLAVYRYSRREINGYSTVYHSEVQIQTGEPEFAVCADYARALMAASGLRSSPFHMEVKIDENGPAMVDLGARLPSEGGGECLSQLHPTRPGVYSVAAHDYLGVPFECGPIDWSAYDSARQVFVFGISTGPGRIDSLDGVSEVEAMPEFISWPVPPEIGTVLEATTDLRGAVYVATLLVPGDDDAVTAAIERVHALVRWNVDPSARSRVAAVAQAVVPRLTKKLRWVGHRALS